MALHAMWIATRINNKPKQQYLLVYRWVTAIGEVIVTN